MKKSFYFLTLFLFIIITNKTYASPTWLGWCCGVERVTPSYGMIYAGDVVKFDLLMNQDYQGLHCDLGWTNGTENMTYIDKDSGNYHWSINRK